MSTTQIPYAEALQKIASLETKLTEFTATKKGAEDKPEDKEQEASFKKAMSEMKNEDKEHSAMHDDHEKVKDAFKQAMDEHDPEKKKEAMKRAMEMKDEHDDKKAKKAKTGEDKPEENVEKKEAKIAAIVMKKIPLMTKILEATKVMDLANYDKVEKELTAATLEEVEAKYATIAPYIAAIGLKESTQSSTTMGMIPFQADAALNKTNPENIFEGSVDSIDFSKVSTKQIMEMYK